jgi:hypothetical protein
MSMTPYLTVPFKFTNEAFDWITNFFDPIVKDFNVNAPRASALLNLSNENMDLLRKSLPWAEVVAFASKCNLRDPYPQMFIYRSVGRRPVQLGNPHIDTAGAGGVEKLVPVRFNILLDGFDNTEMVWWDINRDDPRVVNFQFQTPDRKFTGRLQADGKNLLEQWNIVGEPAFRANNLCKIQECASFVRTDMLHALNWTGVDPRLIFSIKFDVDSWDQIENLRQDGARF